MSNIIDYAKQYQEPFDERAFADVDSLVLCMLTMLHWDELMLSPGTKLYAGMQLGDLEDKQIDRLMEGIWNHKDARALVLAVRENPRFRSLRLTDFVNQIDTQVEKQFAAVCFHLDEEHCYVSYRGTDQYLVGWKEDFNMAYQMPVPSQIDGVRYLEQIADLYPSKRLIVGGYSKGGNVAVYAPMHAEPEVRARIDAIYNHDGPGFPEGTLDNELYSAIRERVDKTLPHSSVVGLLLEHQDTYRVVSSKSPWMIQHNPYTWLLSGSDFLYEERLDPRAIERSEHVRAWLRTMDREARETYVNSLYEIITATGARTYFDLKDDWLTQARTILHAMHGLDPEIKELLRTSLRSFFDIARS